MKYSGTIQYVGVDNLMIKSTSKMFGSLIGQEVVTIILQDSHPGCNDNVEHLSLHTRVSHT